MAAKMERTQYPGIYKRGSRYVVRWRDRGVERKQSFRTLADARRAQGRRRQPGESRAETNQRFDAYAEHWLQTYDGRSGQGLANSTRTSYARTIEQQAIPFFGRLKLADVAPPDVREWVKWMQANGVGPSMLRKNMAALKVLLATAYEDGLIRSNPAQIRLRMPSSGERKAKALTREELAAVLAGMPDRERPLFTFLAHTGLRISEALGLAWADLELGTKPVVRVRRQRYKGELKVLKTANSKRDVPLSQGTVDMLLQLRAARYFGPDAPVFCTRTGKPLDAHNLRTRVLRPLGRDLGLPWLGCHTFRHTCASLLFANGKDVKQVQEWLGHADPGFTLRTYIHLVDEGLGSADFLDALVPPTSTGAERSAL